jgi:hypothetical protein
MATFPIPTGHVLLAAILALGGLGAVTAQEANPRSAAAEAKPGQSVIRVGPQRRIKTIAQAAKAARRGDIVEIEAGDYVGDVAVWAQSDVVIRGVGGKPRIVANGASAEGKGTFVVRAENVVIENVALIGSKVPDRNGSGIRLERGSVTVRGVSFAANEMAILTSNDPTARLEVIDCDFEGDDSRDRQISHVLYAGNIDRLVVQGSYFRRGKIGHLIKSRARASYILYNRLSDETGTASYEAEFPAGGLAIVVGNLIQQSPDTDNPTIVSFGAEGYRWPLNELHLVHNTIVNDRSPGGTWVAVRPGNARTRLVNNLFVGIGRFDVRAPHESVGNAFPSRAEFGNPDAFDYRLRIRSALAGAATDPGEARDVRLRPSRQYEHPARSLPLPRATPLTPLSPGAFQQLAP